MQFVNKKYQKEIRNIRAENNILPWKTIGLKIFARGKSLETIEKTLELIAWITKADEYELINKKLEDDDIIKRRYN